MGCIVLPGDFETMGKNAFFPSENFYLQRLQVQTTGKDGKRRHPSVELNEGATHDRYQGYSRRNEVAAGNGICCTVARPCTDRAFRETVGNRYDGLEQEIWMELSRAAAHIARDLTLPARNAAEHSQERSDCRDDHPVRPDMEERSD